jgi:lysophospholipase L1-like esterase
LGDSFTFGWGVELEDTWVKQLEKILNKNVKKV